MNKIKPAAFARFAAASVLSSIGVGAQGVPARLEPFVTAGTRTPAPPSTLGTVVNQITAAELARRQQTSLKDALGRVWQCGTMQVDFNMPERLGAEYVADDSSRRTPVMLHRAIVGSMERFIGILIENFAGAMPLWLSPLQVVVSPITDAQADYATEIQQSLKKHGFRATPDLRNEKISYKIREHSLQKVPYVLVVGDKEKAAGTVAVRARGNHDLGVMPIAALIERLQTEVSSRA